MNILICDDDKQYIEKNETIVKNFFREKSIPLSIDTFTDGQEAINSVNKVYDIAFLDIVMGDIKGTQIAERIKLQNPHTLLFFITSYDSYLDDALDLSAFRFLTKPIDKDRLLRGLESATDKIDSFVVEFMLKDGDSIYKINSGNIIFVEITGRFTKVVTFSKTLYSSDRIEQWQHKLPSGNFYRIHKSFIINSDYITKYSRDDVTLVDKYVIPIAYRERTTFKQYFTKRIEELHK